MTQRDSFLATIRRRLRDGGAASHLRPIMDAPNGPIHYTIDLSDRVAAFRSAATAVDAEVIASNGQSIEQVLQHALELTDPGTVAVSGDGECDGVEQLLRDAGIVVVGRHDLAGLANADLGITGAVAGVALTGSLVVDSQRANGRLVSLLPRTHLALLSVDRIVAQPGDVLRNLDKWVPTGLPSNLVFITGPSRSADIELQLTKGVHGPQRVLIALR